MSDSWIDSLTGCRSCRELLKANTQKLIKVFLCN